MKQKLVSEKLQRLAIPGRVEFANGGGGLPLIKITTPWSTAEIYLLGAHVAGFQKNGEPPLLFMSAKSYFAPGKPIRGGVPICFPWFGPREGEPAHGLVRILPWELVETAAAPDGAVTVRLRLPKAFVKPEWAALRTEFVLTVAEKLTMELIPKNESADKILEIENCLHTYFRVGDINQISLTGLQGAPFDDFAAGAAGARKAENDSALRITKETNRVYPDSTSTVEIHDAQLKRTIRVEKSNSKSTVVWNPWTTQKLPDDFDPAEHKQMVCVESGNVKQNKISLAPGVLTSLKVVLDSQLE
jgi:glucose-6-phosphate 1-epimerase